MPLIRLQTAADLPEDRKATVLSGLSKIVETQTGKPESVIMVTLDTGDLMMAGTTGNAAYLDVRGIGGLTGPVNRAITSDICDLLEAELSIPSSRVYVTFTEVSASHWGWDGRTFG